MRRSFRPLLYCLLLSVPVGCTAASNDKAPQPQPPVDEVPAIEDTDKDGISDADEGRDEEIDTDSDGVPDFEDADSDGDGLPDKLEGAIPTGQTALPDSDGDGVPDFRDEDSDGNGI